METTLFKVTFSDGRIFKIFCANRNQKYRMFVTSNAILKHDPKCVRVVLENGIHDITQWEQIVNKL